MRFTRVASETDTSARRSDTAHRELQGVTNSGAKSPAAPGSLAGEERYAGQEADRFARDLAVQLAGHDHLKRLGVTLIPATAPDFFTEDTPTAVLVRQVLGAIAQFDKATTIAKLKAARDRKIAAGEKCGGRKSYAERDPEMVDLARWLRHKTRSALFAAPGGCGAGRVWLPRSKRRALRCCGDRLDAGRIAAPGSVSIRAGSIPPSRIDRSTRGPRLAVL